MIRVAFVEDEPATLQTTRVYLVRYTQGKGISLQVDHHHRAELLERYASRYELILLDIRLKDALTGMEAAQKIRKPDTLDSQPCSLSAVLRDGLRQQSAGSLLAPRHPSASSAFQEASKNLGQPASITNYFYTDLSCLFVPCIPFSLLSNKKFFVTFCGRLDKAARMW